jgi:ParB-like chromosome segregation protein Spo0J
MPLVTSGASRGALHPARSSQIEEHLDRRYVVYTFEPNYPVGRVRTVEGNQVRLTNHRAPKRALERYVQQMRNGAIFPGIVVNDAGELVDGNTRLAAKQRLKCDTIPAYVCSDLTPLVGRALSVELNQSHGEAMKSEEIHAFVISAVRDGQKLDLSAYARITGINRQTLGRWINAEQARRRITRAGLSDQFEQLPEPVRAALQKIRLQSVFVAGARLAIDARLTTAVIKGIVREVNAAGSEDEALALIDDEGEARAADIAALAAGFQPARRRSASAAGHLAALVRLEASDLADVAPEKIPVAISRMEQVHAQLGIALRTLRSAELIPAGAGAVDHHGDAA